MEAVTLSPWARYMKAAPTPNQLRAKRREEWNGRGNPPTRVTPPMERLLVAVLRHGVLNHGLGMRAANAIEPGSGERPIAPRTFSDHLTKLRQLGLITTSTATANPLGQIIGITPRGVSYVRGWGLYTLGTPRLEATPHSDHRHRLAIADLAMNYESGGWIVLTEKEIRWAEGIADNGKTARELGQSIASMRNVINYDGRPLTFVFEHRIPGRSGLHLHYPDMVLADPTEPERGLLAAEVELTLKSRAALTNTIERYYHHSPFSEVDWWCTPRPHLTLQGGIEGRPGVICDLNKHAQRYGLVSLGQKIVWPADMHRAHPTVPALDQHVAYGIDTLGLKGTSLASITYAQWLGLRTEWERAGEPGDALLWWLAEQKRIHF